VLLDANIVIIAHELGVWDLLKNAYEITLPAIVCRREALYYFKDGEKLQIQLREQIKSGEIDEIEGTGDELNKLVNLFESYFLDTLDAGELEALALIYSRRVNNAVFCTGDGPAIKALVMMGASGLGISLETALNKIGLTKKLRIQYTEDFYKKCCNQGGLNLAQGLGIRPKKK
jgi:hypothetical protein